MNKSKFTPAGRRIGSPWAIAAALAVGAPLAGCDFDDMLKVPDPAVVTEDAYDNPDALPGIVAGAIRDFNIAYSGSGGDALLSNVANFTDEMHNADTFPTRITTDRRDHFPIAQGNTSDDAYVRLHRARRALYVAADVTTKVAGATDPRVATLKSLEGLTYIGIGENFCGNVPFSMVEDGEWVYGEPLSTSQIFTDAVNRFDAALTANNASDLAKVGKARALLNNGEYAAAAAAVADVPTDFVFGVEHSLNTSGQQNPLWSLQSNGRYTMADQEGVNGLPFRSAGDPRTPWKLSADKGFDKETDLYISLRSATGDAKLAVASGVEARLIEAEALLDAKDYAGWIGKLNELRQNVGPLMEKLVSDYDVASPSLPDLVDPGADEARVDLMFYERAFWLYGTAHRLGDLRRMVRQYGRDQADVFPSGKFFKDGDYGNHVVLPVSFNEINNDKFKLEMCDLTKA
jgi:hypothetical protein